MKFKKKLPVPIPAELLILIGATLVSYLIEAEEKYDVNVIAYIPDGVYSLYTRCIAYMPDV